MPRKDLGFSLIELMIVIAIIGILATIAIGMYSSFRVKSYNSQAVADIYQFRPMGSGRKGPGAAGNNGKKRVFIMVNSVEIGTNRQRG